MKRERFNYGILPVLLLLPTLSGGQVIDFERTPSGAVPTDNMALSRLTPYDAGGVDVTFGFDTNGDGVADLDAVFEKRGTDGNDGFVSSTGSHNNDSERSGATSSLGQFFLRQPAAIGEVPGTFVITYSQDVSALSGEIWDLDAFGDVYEQWRVRSYDAGGQLLETLDSPVGLEEQEPASLESLPWVFALQHSGIRRVEISYRGTAPQVGLAFDNFRPTTLPDLPPLEIDLAILLKFQSVSGANYVIEESTDNINWSDAVTGIVGDGSEMKFFFEITTPRRFYRLKPPGE